MGSLTRTPRANLPAALPALSDDLKSWLLRDPGNTEYVTRKDGSAGIHVFRYRTPLSAALKAEAAAVLPGYAAAVRGPSPAHFAAWIGPIALTVRNAMAADEIEGIATQFAALLVDIPSGAFTAATQLQASHTFKFWPSPADIVELVADEARDIRRAVEVLTFIVQGDRA